MTIDEAMGDLRDAAALAIGRGSLMFHLDLATEAAHAALMAQGVATDALAATADASGYRVFAVDLGASPRVLASVGFDADGRAVVDTRAQAVDPLVEAVARGRLAIAGRGVAAIVIPSRKATTLEGYAVAVDPSPGEPILEGHRRLTLTRDGRRVTGTQPLSAGTQAGRADGAALLATPDATPNELHTYLSLKHDAPLLVDTAASGLRWRVDGERATLV